MYLDINDVNKIDNRVIKTLLSKSLNKGSLPTDNWFPEGVELDLNPTNFIIKLGDIILYYTQVQYEESIAYFKKQHPNLYANRLL